MELVHVFYKMKTLLILSTLLFASVIGLGQSPDAISLTNMDTDRNIGVIELRNYLLKPKTYANFQTLFNSQFVEPMNELGGYTVGQFRLEGEPDHFVWMRAFQDMKTRVDFLNAFYLNSAVWKKYRNEANGMMINSDNVYLLRPLAESGNLNEAITVKKSGLMKRSGITVVDFYICNGRLEPTIDLFEKEYLPYLKTHGISPTLWVSEMAENDFPRLPAFQDKNLLVTMTSFPNESEYDSKIKQIDSPGAELRNKILELVTVHHRLVLHNYDDSSH